MAYREQVWDLWFGLKNVERKGDWPKLSASSKAPTKVPLSSKLQHQLHKCLSLGDLCGNAIILHFNTFDGFESGCVKVWLCLRIKHTQASESAKCGFRLYQMLPQTLLPLSPWHRHTLPFSISLPGHMRILLSPTPGRVKGQGRHPWRW